MKELEMYDVEKVAGGDLFGTAGTVVAGTVNTVDVAVNDITANATNILDDAAHGLSLGIL